MEGRDDKFVQNVREESLKGKAQCGVYMIGGRLQKYVRTK